jgi:arylsulfatase A-like enzyme
MKLDGVNLVPFLSGQRKEAPHERVCVKRQGLGMVREGRYKLITGTGKREHELYDVESDLGETKNIAAENSDLARRLDAAWQTWNAEMAPPLWKPVPEKEWKRPEYQPPLMPDELAAQP